MKIAASIFCLAIAGCAAPQYNYRPQQQYVIEPAVGVEASVTVGDDILMQGRFTVRDAIRIPNPIQIAMYKVAPGYFKKIGETADGDFFAPAGGADGGSVIQGLLSDPPEALLVRRSEQDLCVVTVFAFRTCNQWTEDGKRLTEPGFERRRVRDYSSGELRELIYDGKMGSRIRLSYRERSGDAAPVTNTVEYDLTESPVITYRGARIAITGATPSSVRFRVLEGFADHPASSQ